MGEFVDKVKGTVNDVAGNVKQAVGKAINNPELVTDGKAQELKGEAQKIAGSVKGSLGDKV